MSTSAASFFARWVGAIARAADRARTQTSCTSPRSPMLCRYRGSYRWATIHIGSGLVYAMPMSYSAHFRCFAGCRGEIPLTSPTYRCPACGGLLEVAHDLDALKDKSAESWRSLFES